MARECIVCGKPIKKRTTTWYLREAREERPATTKIVCGRPLIDDHYMPAKPAGLIERNNYSATLYLDTLPRSKEECARLTNEEIVSVTRHHSGEAISKFSTWDGESYEDEFFHSNECAVKQGHASAAHGHRYVWKKVDD